MQCAVCFDPIDKARPGFRPRCKHVIHPACLATWQERSPTCPTCRRAIPLQPTAETAQAFIRRERASLISKGIAEHALLQLRQRGDTAKFNAQQRLERERHMLSQELALARLDRALAKRRRTIHAEGLKCSKRFKIDTDCAAMKAQADTELAAAEQRYHTLAAKEAERKAQIIV